MERFTVGSRKWLRTFGTLLRLSRLAPFVPSVSALHVVPGSNCTGVCSQHVDATNTTLGDVTCYDEDYNGTDVGRAFRDCVSCEMKSQTFNHKSAQTDLGWALCMLSSFLAVGECSMADTDVSGRQYEIYRGYLRI